MKKIIIIYDYFDPAFKAGGIIKSLKGIVDILKDIFQFSVITSAYDLKDPVLLPGIETNRWIKKENYEITYLTKGFKTYRDLLKHILRFRDETFYFNGIYSFKFFIFPILILQLIGKKEGIIIAPRGMVQQGALQLKKVKKKIFLYFLKKLPIIKTATWHATDPTEKIDIHKTFGNDILIKLEKIILAKEISLLSSFKIQMPYKTKNSSNFNTVSIIAEKKNHLSFLNLLLKSKPEWQINYNIYGPIKDQHYWNRCLDVIKVLPKNVKVNYHGFLNPNQLKEAFDNNHFFVLPTLGENFGHAILEALNFGQPVLLSDKTPWDDLTEKGSGWIFKNDTEFFEIIETCMEMENEEYKAKSKLARKHADEFYTIDDSVQAYSRLFN